MGLKERKMEIETRKIVKKTIVYKDENGKIFKEYIEKENGYVEKQNINIKDINMFSNNPQNRYIYINGKEYLLTKKSYTQLKKEIEKNGLMYRFNHERI